MKHFVLSLLVLSWLACDPTVRIGDADGGVDAGGAGGGGAGGGSAGGGGAGSDPLCNRWATASDTFFSGQSTCVGTTNTITRDPNATVTCLGGVAQCSTQDRATLQTYLGCLESGPHCSAGNENTAVNGFMSCVSTAFSTLSQTCRSALVRVRPAGKRVFVTSEEFTGDLGGLAGADAKCTSAATTAGLNGTFVAWLSSSTVNAVDRVTDVSPWLNMEGNVAFATKAALIDGPTMPVWHDEFGRILSTEHTWTGTGFQGVYVAALQGNPPCAEWTSAAMTKQARIGQIGRIGLPWTSFSNTTCDQNGHLICLEQ